MSDTYLTIEGPSEGIYKEKGSKFIARAFPVPNEEEAMEIVKGLRKEYHDARHHCFAYALGYQGEVWRANDDGEPSGTAGKPIHGQIVARSLTFILVVVTRYFGGTKLGTSGLINAYRTATSDALDGVTIVEKSIDNIYRISFSYLAMNDVMKLAKMLDLPIINQHFDNECWLELSVRLSKAEEFVSKLEKIDTAIAQLVETR